MCAEKVQYGTFLLSYKVGVVPPGLGDTQAHVLEALRVLDDEQDEVIFDTGCTLHVLKSGEGLFDLRKAPVGSCIKGVGGTATIMHAGKMLGIGRVFVAPDGANLISVSQLAESGANFSGDSKELVVRDKNEWIRQWRVS
jgi:hypothetical protein